jgi:hypothetical protein
VSISYLVNCYKEVPAKKNSTKNAIKKKKMQIKMYVEFKIPNKISIVLFAKPKSLISLRPRVTIVLLTLGSCT